MNEWKDENSATSEGEGEESGNKDGYGDLIKAKDNCVCVFCNDHDHGDSYDGIIDTHTHTHSLTRHSIQSGDMSTWTGSGCVCFQHYMTRALAKMTVASCFLLFFCFSINIIIILS